MMKKIIFLMAFSLGLFSFNTSFAQYTTGVGLRAGVTNGLTVKHFISQDAALEGILHARWGGFMITGLYEVHRDIREVKGLQWFFGGGVHLGTWNTRNTSSSNRPPWAEPNRSYSVFGLNGIIGLDYNFQDAPIGLSLDWKPAINLGYYNYGWDEVALSIRYVF